jgi:hypothetical protein
LLSNECKCHFFECKLLSNECKCHFFECKLLSNESIVRTVILRMIILIYMINNHKNQINHAKITVRTNNHKVSCRFRRYRFTFPKIYYISDYKSLYSKQRSNLHSPESNLHPKKHRLQSSECIL